MEGTKKIKSRSFHQYSWNSEVDTTWISLIGWPNKTSNREGPCLMLLLVLEKNCIIQNLLLFVCYQVAILTSQFFVQTLSSFFIFETSPYYYAKVRKNNDAIWKKILWKSLTIFGSPKKGRIDSLGATDSPSACFQSQFAREVVQVSNFQKVSFVLPFYFYQIIWTEILLAVYIKLSQLQ